MLALKEIFRIRVNNSLTMFLFMMEDCFGRSSLAMTMKYVKIIISHSRGESLRVYEAILHSEFNNMLALKEIFRIRTNNSLTMFLFMMEDCFGRSSLAMTMKYVKIIKSHSR